MKTLLIDPFTKTVTEHDYDGSLDAMYKLLDCDTVEMVKYNDAGKDMFKGEDCLFVDEEGLLCNLDMQAFFIIDGKPIAGRAMTVGCDEEGETIEANITMEDLRMLDIQWVTLAQLREMY
jgi:hypothetical protein